VNADNVAAYAAEWVRAEQARAEARKERNGLVVAAGDSCTRLAVAKSDDEFSTCSRYLGEFDRDRLCGSAACERLFDAGIAYRRAAATAGAARRNLVRAVTKWEDPT
jgi:CO dehydrogenase/acetyl-CoA synthase alpha subunit